MKALLHAFADDVSKKDLLMLLWRSILPNNTFDAKPSVTDDNASKLCNGQIPVPKIIQREARKEEIRKNIPGYFQKVILHRIAPEKINQLKKELLEMVHLDRELLQEDQKMLAASLEKNDLSHSLSNLFLFAISKENRPWNLRPRTKRGSKPEDLPFFWQSDKQPPLNSRDIFEPPSMPETPTEEERKYIHALLEVYGEKRGKSEFTMAMLQADPACLENFKYHRDNYWAAHTLERETRESANSYDPGIFQKAEDDVYTGIFPDYTASYPTGMDRLDKVTRTAMLLPMNAFYENAINCRLTNQTKAGMLHDMVSKGRLKGWVKHEP